MSYAGLSDLNGLSTAKNRLLINLNLPDRLIDSFFNSKKPLLKKTIDKP
jgi:hypothetical protein